MQSSLRYCERLLAAKGKSFALAARFLAGEARLGTCALYAFFRTVDDWLRLRWWRSGRGIVVCEGCFKERLCR